MSSVDVVRETALAGRPVRWEESARDRAQGKTLMSADFRVELARAQGAMFGEDGPRHLVFAAGFPAVCPEEFEATRRVALEAAGAVSPAAVCRATPKDVLHACHAVEGAPHARIMIVVPSSDEVADPMAHTTAAEALRHAVTLVRLVHESATDVVPDICFADAPRADVGLLARSAGELTAAGAGVIVVADTTGDMLHMHAGELFGQLRSLCHEDVVLVTHLHNDLGLGLVNTLEAVRGVSSSWLGVAERSGMVATEQVLFLLAHRANELLGADADLWYTPAGPDPDSCHRTESRRGDRVANQRDHADRRHWRRDHLHRHAVRAPRHFPAVRSEGRARDRADRSADPSRQRASTARGR